MNKNQRRLLTCGVFFGGTLLATLQYTAARSQEGATTTTGVRSSTPVEAVSIADSPFVAKAVAAAPIKMNWSNVAIGGGGWCLEVQANPNVPGLLWMRSDVTGPWKRTAKDAVWKPQNLLQKYQPKTIGGVGGIAFDPTNPDVVYAERGDAWKVGVGLYKTTDGGASWTRILEKYADANRGGARKWGSCLAVDPNNPNVVYWGTRIDGLWRSLDAGKTWQNVWAAPPAPAGKKPLDYLDPGIRAVVVDGSQTTGTGSARRSSRIYFHMNGGKEFPDDLRGVYASADGGGAFARMPEFSSIAGNTNAPWAGISKDGVFYIQNGKGVFRYSVRGGWSNVTPPQWTEARDGLAVDPNDSNRVLFWGMSKVKGAPNRKWNHAALFRTVDGGKSWSLLTNDDPGQMKLIGAEGWHFKDVGLAPSSLTIDPFNAKTAYFTDAYSAYKTKDVWAPQVTWELYSQGIENIILLNLTTPPASKTGVTAPLYSGVSDVDGFRHADPKKEPVERIRPPRYDDSSYNTGFDYCENKPEILMTARHNQDFKPSTVIATTDGGKNWREVTPPIVANFGGAKMAVAANCTSINDLHAVFAPGDGNNVRVTTDGGKTWKDALEAATGKPLGPISWERDAYTYFRNVAADRVNPDVFYIYRFKTKELLVSRDGGQTFSAKPMPFGGASISDDKSPIWIEAAPGRSGEVWAALSSGGLWRTLDFGESWQEVAFLEFGSRAAGKPDPRPILFAFGKAAPGKAASEPTIYVIGRANGASKTGIYRSLDIRNPDAAQMQWEKITDWPFDAFDSHIFAADRQTFGRLYLSGPGIVMGEIAP